MEVMRETEGIGLVGLWSLVIGMVWVERNWRGSSKSSHFCFLEVQKQSQSNESMVFQRFWERFKLTVTKANLWKLLLSFSGFGPISVELRSNPLSLPSYPNDCRTNLASMFLFLSSLEKFYSMVQFIVLLHYSFLYLKKKLSQPMHK